VKRWDVSAKEPAELPSITGHKGWVSALAFAGVALYSVDSWGRLSCSDVTAKEPKLWTVEVAHDGWTRDVAIAAGESPVATCGKDGFVRLWQPESGKKLDQIDLKSDILSVCFTPDGKSVFAGDLFGIVREIVAGKVTRTFEAKEAYKLDRIQDVGGVKCLLVSGDGKTLFAGGGEPKTGGFVQAIPLLLAFDLATGKRVSQWKGAGDNEGYVTDLAWHPDGHVVFTTSGQPGQGKLCFWKPGQEKPFFVSTKQPNCHSVAISPDGKTLAVSATNANSSGNGRVKGAGGDYPANSSPIQLWGVPRG
jgi:WD40 repeat protein